MPTSRYERAMPDKNQEIFFETFKLGFGPNAICAWSHGLLNFSFCPGDSASNGWHFFWPASQTYHRIRHMIRNVNVPSGTRVRFLYLFVCIEGVTRSSTFYFFFFRTNKEPTSPFYVLPFGLLDVHVNIDDWTNFKVDLYVYYLD